MNLKHYKKFVTFFLILGLCTGNNAMNMNIPSRAIHLSAVNASSRIQAFLLGLGTPQKNNLYYVFNILSCCFTLNNALKTGKLNGYIHNSSIKYEQLKAISENIFFYAAGFLLRYFIISRMSKNPSTFQWAFSWFIAPTNWVCFASAALIPEIFFRVNYSETLKYHGNYLVGNIHLKARKQIDELKLEDYEIEALKTLMIEHGTTPHKLNPHPLKTAFTSNIPELTTFLVNEIYTKPEHVFTKEHFTLAIAYDQQEVVDAVFKQVLTLYEQNPQAYTRKLMTTFVGIITSFQTPSQQELQLLEYLFEQLQITGYNPLYVTSEDTGTIINFVTSMFNESPLITLLRTCNDPQKFIAHNNHLVHDSIKYFVETGMSIYKRKNYKNDTLSLNIASDLPYDYTDNNAIMRNYLQRVGRYNKKLLDDKDNLEIFITKLNAYQQDDIFYIAATRGHMFTLNILNKIAPEEYSLQKAANLAMRRRCEKTIPQYLNRIPNLQEYFEKTFTEEKDKKFIDHTKNVTENNITLFDDALGNPSNEIYSEVFSCMYDTINRANRQRLSAMITVFRQPQGVFSSLKKFN